MSVLVRMSVAGMDAATYDQVSKQLVDLVKKRCNSSTVYRFQD